MCGRNIKEFDMTMGVVVRNTKGDKLKFRGIVNNKIKFEQLSGTPYDKYLLDRNDLLSFNYEPLCDFWVTFFFNNFKFGR